MGNQQALVDNSKCFYVWKTKLYQASARGDLFWEQKGCFGRVVFGKPKSAWAGAGCKKAGRFKVCFKSRRPATSPGSSTHSNFHGRVPRRPARHLRQLRRGCKFFKSQAAKQQQHHGRHINTDFLESSRIDPDSGSAKSFLWKDQELCLLLGSHSNGSRWKVRTFRSGPIKFQLNSNQNHPTDGYPMINYWKTIWRFRTHLCKVLFGVLAGARGARARFNHHGHTRDPGLLTSMSSMYAMVETTCCTAATKKCWW